jgi:hypothetical protein
VAWPQIGASIAGVNQRRPNRAGSAVLQQEGGLGLIVLGRQGLHPGGVGPTLERLDHAGRIALERARGEGVDGPLAHGEAPEERSVSRS